MPEHDHSNVMQNCPSSHGMIGDEPIRSMHSTNGHKSSDTIQNPSGCDDFHPIERSTPVETPKISLEKIIDDAIRQSIKPVSSGTTISKSNEEQTGEPLLTVVPTTTTIIDLATWANNEKTIDLSNNTGMVSLKYSANDADISIAIYMDSDSELSPSKLK